MTGPIRPEPPPSNPQHDHGSEQSKYELGWRKALKYWAEIVAIAIGLVVVFLTGMQTYFLRQQVIDARQSAEEAETASKEMMTKFERMVSTSEAQALTSEDAVRETISHNAQLLKQTDRSLTESERRFRVSERPWIGFVEALDVRVLAGEKSQERMQFLNSGRSPATDIRICGKVSMGDPRNYSPAAPPNCETSTQESSTTLLIPNDRAGLSVLLRGKVPLTDADIQSLKDYRTRLRGFGWIQYWDAFEPRRCHVLQFCTYYWPPDNQFKNCEEGNETYECPTQTPN